MRSIINRLARKIALATSAPAPPAPIQDMPAQANLKPGGTVVRMAETFLPRIAANMVVFGVGYYFIYESQNYRDAERENRERRGEERAAAYEAREIRKMDREKLNFESQSKHELEREDRERSAEDRAIAHEDREMRQTQRDKEQEERAIERAECQRETQQLERSRQIRERSRELRELRAEKRAKQNDPSRKLEPGWEQALESELRNQYMTQAVALQQDLSHWERGGDQAFKEELRHMRDEGDKMISAATAEEKPQAQEETERTQPEKLAPSLSSPALEPPSQDPK